MFEGHILRVGDLLPLRCEVICKADMIDRAVAGEVGTLARVVTGGIDSIGQDMPAEPKTHPRTSWFKIGFPGLPSVRCPQFLPRF